MKRTPIQEKIVGSRSTECASLDEEAIKQIEVRWAAESEERIDAVDRGELQTIGGSAALRELRSSLGKCCRNE